VALTKYNFNSFDVTSAASKALGFNSSANGFATIGSGSMTLIKTLTASSSSNLQFVNGSSDVVFDSTYPVYLFKCIGLHPSASAPAFNFQVDTGTNTSYNQTVTTTNFRAYHYENDSDAGVGYKSSDDLAQSSSNVLLIDGVGDSNDACTSGHVYLFNPSSTTFVKHFMANFMDDYDSSIANHYFTAGYFNTTTALTRVQFKMSSGNIDAGTIKLYGIKDS